MIISNFTTYVFRGSAKLQKEKNELQENRKQRSLLEQLQMLEKEGKGTFCFDICIFKFRE